MDKGMENGSLAHAGVYRDCPVLISRPLQYHYRSGPCIWWNICHPGGIVRERWLSSFAVICVNGNLSENVSDYNEKSLILVFPGLPMRVLLCLLTILPTQDNVNCQPRNTGAMSLNTCILERVRAAHLLLGVSFPKTQQGGPGAWEPKATTMWLGFISLRAQAPKNHILTQNLYRNYYCPKPKYLIIGYMDPKP